MTVAAACFAERYAHTLPNFNDALQPMVQSPLSRALRRNQRRACAHVLPQGARDCTQFECVCALRCAFSLGECVLSARVRACVGVKPLPSLLPSALHACTQPSMPSREKSVAPSLIGPMTSSLTNELAFYRLGSGVAPQLL